MGGGKINFQNVKKPATAYFSSALTLTPWQASTSPHGKDQGKTRGGARSPQGFSSVSVSNEIMC